jgi:hypothetical protein
MTVADKTREQLLHAEQMAGYWLALGNAASERGDKDLAERHYDRSQKWLDRANELAGNN